MNLPQPQRQRGHLVRTVLAEAPNVAGRTPPHDLDAEATVLGSCILEVSAIDRVRVLVEPDHFYSEANATIFCGILELHDARQKVDVVAVSSWLMDRELIAKVGGRPYLAQLTDATPAVFNLEQHARTVRLKKRLRQWISLCHLYAGQGYGDVGDAERWMLDGLGTFEQVARDERGDGVTYVGAAMAPLHARLAAAQERGDAITGIATGIPELDRVTKGHQRKDLILVTGPKGKGKTALAVNTFGVHAARRGHGVLVFSMEMPLERLAARIVATVGRVDATKFKTPAALDGHDWRDITNAAETVNRWPLAIDDRKRLNAHQIRARVLEVRQQMAQRGVDLAMVIVDYAQIGGYADHASDGDIVKGLSKFGELLVSVAEDANVAMLLLAQLSANGNIKWCADLEAHAHAWIDIKRDGRANEGEPEGGHLKIRKQRDGEDDAEVPIWWHGQYLQFTGGE